MTSGATKTLSVSKLNCNPLQKLTNSTIRVIHIDNQLRQSRAGSALNSSLAKAASSWRDAFRSRCHSHGKQTRR
jgi:hypothetical protein